MQCPLVSRTNKSQKKDFQTPQTLQLKNLHFSEISAGDIINNSVGKTVQENEAIGKDQFKTFIEERLEKCEKPITEPIIKNKLSLFSKTTVKHPTTQQN